MALFFSLSLSLFLPSLLLTFSSFSSLHFIIFITMSTLIPCVWCEAYFYTEEMNAHAEVCLYRHTLDSLFDSSSEGTTTYIEEPLTALDSDMPDFDSDHMDSLSQFESPAFDDFIEADSQEMEAPINITFPPKNMELQYMALFGLDLEKIVLDNRITEKGYAAVVKLINEIVAKVAPGKCQRYIERFVRTKLIFVSIELGHERLPSPYKSRKQLEQAYPVKAMRYDTCVDGCMLFTNDTEVECCQCHQHRYDDDLKPLRTINVLPITQQLGLLLFNKKTRQDLHYRSEYSLSGNYDDIFGGSYYQELKDDHFTNQYDIALGLYTDGFTPSSKSSSSLTMVHLVIYNYHPSIR